jgi:hypothetical protein
MKKSILALSTALALAANAQLTTNSPGVVNLTGTTYPPGTLTNFLVVSKAGNDQSGRRNNQGLPFATIAAAVSNACPGDTVVVYPGTYNDHDLLKTNVNFIGLPGADIVYAVTSTNTPGWGISDDRHSLGGTTNYIEWPGRIVMIGYTNILPIAVDDGGSFVNSLNPGTQGPICVTNPATQINVTVGKLGMSKAQGTSGSCIYYQNGRRSHFTVGEMFDPNDGFSIADDGFGNGFTSACSGISWGIGDLYVNCDENNANGAYGILWIEPTGLHTNSLYYRGKAMHSKAYGDSHSANYRMWCSIDEIVMRPSNTTGAGSIAVDCYGAGGKFYFTCQKIGGYGNGAVIDTTGEGDATTNQLQVWITAQKISSASTTSGASWVTPNGGSMWINCDHFEDVTGNVTGGGFVFGGNASSSHLTVRGGVARCQGTAITHTSGDALFQNLHVITTNANPVIVAGAGLKLQNAVLVRDGTTGNSISSGSAQTVNIYGTVAANVAKHANITVGASGTLTVDTAVK